MIRLDLVKIFSESCNESDFQESYPGRRGQEWAPKGQKNRLAGSGAWSGRLSYSGPDWLWGSSSGFSDLYTTNLGNMFSELSVWVFLGTVIAVRSRTPFQAAGTVFGFCFGMLAAYYTTARLTHSLYSPVMARGWWIFSLLTPLLGYCAWHAGGRGRTARLLAIGIIAVTPAAAVLLFDRMRGRDLLLMALTGAVLYREQRGRIRGKARCWRGGV